MGSTKTATRKSTSQTANTPGITLLHTQSEYLIETQSGKLCIPIANASISPYFDAGALHRREIERLQAVFQDSKQNRELSRESVVDDLCSRYLIDTNDARTLKKALKLVRSNELKPANRKLKSLKELRQRLVEKSINPISVTLASVFVASASNSVDTIAVITGTEPVAGDTVGPATADADGGLWGAGAGAGAGSAIPGVGTLAGGILGGLYGAAIGTIVHALDELEEDDLPSTPRQDTFGADVPDWLSSPFICTTRSPMFTAVSAGEIHDQLVRFGLRYFKNVGASSTDVRWPAVSVFCDLKLISSYECLILREIEKNGAVINQISDDNLPEARRSAKQISVLYEKLQSENASQTSLILASIADDSAGMSIDYFLDSNGDPGVAKGFWGSDWSGAKTGGSIGAAAGATAGAGAGGVGAVPGGAAGAAVGAAAGAAVKSFAWWVDNQ